MQFTNQQEEALSRFKNWYANRRSEKAVFRLFGYAGTGKSTLSRALAEEIGGGVLYGAYTGKAASVMRDKGCDGATTIHKLIYLPSGGKRDAIKETEEQMARVAGTVQPGEPMPAEYERLRRQLADLKKPSFVLNPDSPVKDAALVILDEASMIDQWIGKDLLSFNVPILVLGDPAQLPPVKGAGFFTSVQPDFLLTEIHRQAQGDPIIELATRARRGDSIPIKQYGTSRKILRRVLTDEDLVNADQIICGKNDVRMKINKKVRQVLGHDGHALPQKGEKLVCLKNQHDAGLLNGQTFYTAGEVERIAEEPLYFNQMLAPEDDKENPFGSFKLNACYFKEYYTPGTIESVPWAQLNAAQRFDFGYALTTHKSQGSQWDDVIFVDDGLFNWDRVARQRLIYTAITRAAKRITIVAYDGS